MIVSDRSWRETLQAFLTPQVITMLFLGIAAGLPLLLIFSSLSLWLREAGVDRSAVTYFSWAALGYSFKFVWAPLVDVLPLPWLSRLLGRRRGWLLLSQLMIIASILMMASIDPQQSSLTWMAVAAVLLGFSSATQDIVIDAYRIESADPDLQGLMSATYIAGYRIGMLIAGAGALFLASHFGTAFGDYQYEAWQHTYQLMALAMLIGVLTTLLCREPRQNRVSYDSPVQHYIGLLLTFALAVSGFVAVFYFSAEAASAAKMALSAYVYNYELAAVIVELLRMIAGLSVAVLIATLLTQTPMVNADMVVHSYVDPVRDFFSRYGLSMALLLLALVGLYRISDIVLGVISNVFYQDMGYSKNEIATVVKTFGLFMTIAGGFLGGILSMRYGVMRILFLGAVLSAATNLLFMLLAQTGYDILMLYIVISADNLSAGLASAAFIAFLSSLTNISFTAVQYAIFSSLMTLMPKILGGYSGSMVETMGYEQFFLLTALLGVPVLILVAMAAKRFRLQAVRE